jgi:hypothetical protein
VLILLIFLRVATLGFGTFLPVNNSIALEVSGPEILITAIPDIQDHLIKHKLSSEDYSFKSRYL